MDRAWNMAQCESRKASAPANSMQTSSGHPIARESVEPSNTGKQKTAQAGAPMDIPERWSSIQWKAIQRHVRRLQMRIAKAVQEKRWNKVKALQYLLTRSFYAKLLAVKRVTSNKGRKTPGVDGILWKTEQSKWKAVNSLKRRGYKPQPLRRIYIPKKNGRKRPLSIPTMYDRAMQALYKLALSPVAETTADKNSYGFREGRGCADAISAAFNALSKPNSAPWVLEGDIKGCFDNISHQWMLDHIVMDKEILNKWLQAGYMEGSVKYPTRKGAPQGGICSPTLSNITLDGLEKAIADSVPRRSRVNFVRYADDFIVTGKSRQLLERNVKPVIEAFLKERGLILSEEKTLITHIRKGFTFLGQTIRKEGKVLRIKPSEEGARSIIRKTGAIIRSHTSAPMPIMIKKLNETLRGWGNYHRCVVSDRTFRRIDGYIYHQLWRMLHRRHPNKSASWLKRQYWNTESGGWSFETTYETKKGARKMKVVRLGKIGIKRHIKIKAEANPYLPEYAYYFHRRRNISGSRCLPALSAREYRKMKSKQVKQPGDSTRVALVDA